MRFTLTMQCDNAAFDDYPQTEIARLLRLAADRLDAQLYTAGSLIDINGNTVGNYKIIGKAKS